MAKEVEYLLVLVDCPGAITAKRIAQDLVANKISARVDILPSITTYFRWGNKVHSDNDLLLLITATSASFPAIKKRIKSLHPHKIPEIIAVSITDGLKEYLRWTEENIE